MSTSSSRVEGPSKTMLGLNEGVAIWGLDGWRFASSHQPAQITARWFMTLKQVSTSFSRDTIFLNIYRRIIFSFSAC